MKQSFTFYLTLFVLKLKGIKKSFSQDPIDFKKIRKEDMHLPKGVFFKRNLVRCFKILNTQISEVKQAAPSNKLLLFVHGGAFVSGPTKLHWDSLRAIVEGTNYTVWMCDYPKAPESDIYEISENIDSVYKTALENYKAEDIVLLGDSVGGTLIAALTQRLIENNIALPRKIILISPVMDATMSNPKILELDSKDPMLSKAGVLSAKKMCAGEADLNDAIISPLNGSFKNFPETVLYLAQNDIMYPDQLLAVQKLREAQVPFEVIFGENMPHIWPFLPVMQEGKIALADIIAHLNPLVTLEDRDEMAKDNTSAGI